MSSKKNWRLMASVVFGLILMAGTAYAQTPDPCIVPNNGMGTVTLPPPGCQYLSPDAVHKIINGLPPNTEIILAPIHTNFICERLGSCGTPGGSLGGEVEVFGSTAVFQLTGTGALAGWSRLVSIPLNTETHTGPRQNGAVVQSFKTDMVRIQGAISGDPDFQTLEIVGGTANNYPSPGQTTLTLQPNGSYLVDSSFQVGFRIRFVGAPGGRLGGLAGTTDGSVRMKAYKKCP
ncbi:MAG TPA: hypothetical protein VG477_16540 [Thermoanaerobaculia bacterium]|nr:hypothetical protein [Thermoanaerobaculia bacterium]